MILQNGPVFSSNYSLDYLTYHIVDILEKVYNAINLNPSLKQAECGDLIIIWDYVEKYNQPTTIKFVYCDVEDLDQDKLRQFVDSMLNVAGIKLVSLNA